jgi:hypothetical protein
MTRQGRGGNEGPDSTVAARYGFAHTLGFAAPEVGSTYRAHDLRDQNPCLPQEIRDPAALLEAHLALGGALSYRGEFTSACGPTVSKASPSTIGNSIAPVPHPRATPGGGEWRAAHLELCSPANLAVPPRSDMWPSTALVPVVTVVPRNAHGPRTARHRPEPRAEPVRRRAHEPVFRPLQCVAPRHRTAAIDPGRDCGTGADSRRWGAFSAMTADIRHLGQDLDQWTLL